MRRRLPIAVALTASLCVVLVRPAVWAQDAPVELTKTDITKLKTLDTRQWAVLGVHLGDSKEAVLRMLQQTGNVRAQDEPGSGRIFVITPPTGNSVVMSVRITENQVTAINVFGGFAEWLQGDTRLLFRGFEDDSLRYKLLGKEDQHEAARGGTNEAPSLDVTYAYYKEGLILHYSVKRAADGKQVEGQREMVLIYPPKAR